jgi:hypothetical protein
MFAIALKVSWTMSRENVNEGRVKWTRLSKVHVVLRTDRQLHKWTTGPLDHWTTFAHGALLFLALSVFTFFRLTNSKLQSAVSQRTEVCELWKRWWLCKFMSPENTKLVITVEIAENSSWSRSLLRDDISWPTNSTAAGIKGKTSFAVTRHGFVFLHPVQ